MATIFATLWSDRLLPVAECGATWFVQSVVLTAAGLLAATAARRCGAATQSLIYRTTLVAVLATPAAAALAASLGCHGWSVDLSGFAPAPDARQTAQTAIAPTVDPATPPIPSEHEMDTQRRDRNRDEAAITAMRRPEETSSHATAKADSSPFHAGFRSGNRYSGLVVSGSVLLWLSISTALLAFVVRSWLVGRSLRRSSIPADRATVALGETMATEYGIECPAIRCSAFVTSPCVVGFLQPAILLSDAALLDIRDVLAHELAHVARRDGLWNLLRQLATACLFPQPLLWYLSRRIEASAEEVCDDCAVGLGADRVRYAEQLCNLAVLNLPSLSAAVGIKTARSALKRRITRVLDSTRELSTEVGRRRAWVIGAAGIVLALLAGAAGASRGPEADADDEAPQSGAAKVASVAEADEPSAAPANGDAPKAERAAARQGRIFARGYVYQNDELQGMSLVSIDPQTGAWKRLVEKPGAIVAVSPDGQTLFYNFYDGPHGLWNGDARENANPGKVYEESGWVAFSPDSWSILLTTPKSKSDNLPVVMKMGLDGSGAVPIPLLAGWEVRDWSSDGRWLLAEKNWLLYVVSPDGDEVRPLLTKHCEYEHFSPDGKQVIYTFPWEGTIRLIKVDGSNDRVFAQEPAMTFAAGPRFSPDSKYVAAVLLDLHEGSLHADSKQSHPRLVIYDAAQPEPKRLELPQQDGWDFYPTGELEWR